MKCLDKDRDRHYESAGSPSNVTRKQRLNVLTGGSASTGVFAGVPGSLQTVALQGSAAPAGGNFVSFLAPALLNSDGQIAFRVNMTGGSATSGIFVGTAGSLQATALQGSPAPGGGTFSLFNFAPQRASQNLLLPM